MSISLHAELEKYKELSDENLCVLVAAGDRAAEESMVLRYARLVRIYARPYFLFGGDSEDLIQEGMLGLLSAMREFSPERKVSFRYYAELCIRRRMISAVRMAAGDKHTPLNTYVSFELSLFVGSQEFVSFGSPLTRQENPEDIIISQERLRSLAKLIKGQLTELEQSILSHYLKGLSYSEIAKEVNRPTKSVDNAVQRIRRKVGRQLQSSEYSES